MPRGKIFISHDLLWLLSEFKSLVKEKIGAATPEWFEDLILAFNDFDPNGTTFRYGGSVESDGVFIDLAHLETLMGWLADSFQRINGKQGNV